MEYEDELAKPLDIVMRHLARNRLGDAFLRKVTNSLDRSRPVVFKRTKSRHFQSMAGRNTSLDERSYNMSSYEHRISGVTPAAPVTPTATRYGADFMARSSSHGSSLKVLSHQNTQSRPQPNRRQIGSRDRNRLTTIFDRRSAYLLQFMNHRQQYLKNNSLDSILTRITGNSNMTNLRVYKEQLKKYYSVRYQKEKLTSFLQYEFIQDYNSQMGVLETLLGLSLNQIHLLCFVVLDLNGDGLLCNDDLFRLLTACPTQNFLLSKDIFTLFDRAGKKESRGMVDEVEEQYTKDPTFTLKKYRLIMLKKEKEKQWEQNNQKKSQFAFLKSTLAVGAKKEKKVIVTGRKITRHLFNFHEQEEQGQAAIKILRKKFAQQNQKSECEFNFKINFERFQAIFKNTIPETYFDILFLQGGVKVRGKPYTPLSFSAIESGQGDKKGSNRVGHDYKEMRRRVDAMRITNQASHVQSLYGSSRRRMTTQ